MMNCVEIQELFSAYLDDQCSLEEKDLVKSHLENCSECLETFNLMKSMIKQLNNVDEYDVPEGFHNELMHKIHDLSPTKQNKFLQFRTSASLVAAAFLFILVFGFVSSGLFEKFSIPESTKIEKSTTVTEETVESADSADSANRANFEAATEAAAETTYDLAAASDEAGNDDLFSAESAPVQDEIAMSKVAEDPAQESEADVAAKQSAPLVLNESEQTTTTTTTEIAAENLLTDEAPSMTPTVVFAFVLSGVIFLIAGIRIIRIIKKRAK